MFKNEFTVWITTLISEYEAVIVARLIKEGYTVGPANKNGSMTISGNYHGAIIAMKIMNNDEKISSNEDFFNKLYSILYELKIKYFSIIITSYIGYSGITTNWMHGNIPLESYSSTEDKKET